MKGKVLGDKGETIAANYLKNHGYTITTQNFRWARGEIDIIAEKPGRARKQQQIAKTALRYLQTTEIPDVDIRLDVIGITYSMGTWYIAHREDAFSL
jgi:putative endonuclease